jgi:hypothetical protein
MVVPGMTRFLLFYALILKPFTGLMESRRRWPRISLPSTSSKRSFNQQSPLASKVHDTKATISSQTHLFLFAFYYRVAGTCGTDTLFALINSRPDFIADASRLITHVVATSAAPRNTNSNGVDDQGPSNAQQP